MLKRSLAFKSPSQIVYPKVGETLGNWKILYAGVDERGILRKYVMQCKCGKKSIKDRSEIRQHALRPNSHWSCHNCAVALHDYSSFYIKYEKKFVDIMRRRWHRRRGARKILNHPGCCDEWFNSFKAFFEYCIELEGCFNLGLDVERKDNSKPYEPGNLRFTTRKENCNNRENTTFIVAVNGKIPLTAWIENQFKYRSSIECPKLYHYVRGLVDKGQSENEILLQTVEWLKHNNVK